MKGKIRKPEDVVNTTFSAMKKNKVVAPDGFFCFLQEKMHHFLSRKMILRVTGTVGKSVCGKDYV